MGKYIIGEFKQHSTLPVSPSWDSPGTNGLGVYFEWKSHDSMGSPCSVHNIICCTKLQKCIQCCSVCVTVLQCYSVTVLGFSDFKSSEFL